MCGHLRATSSRMPIPRAPPALRLRLIHAQTSHTTQVSLLDATALDSTMLVTAKNLDAHAPEPAAAVARPPEGGSASNSAASQQQEETIANLKQVRVV